MRNPKPNDNTGIHSGQKGRKMQRRLPSRYDSITDLPQSIIETILTKLPLRDAVRTSILSSKWRYKWAALTNLVFNDTCIFGTKDKSLSQFISRFLLLHDGPINTFVLSTGYLQRSSDVDQWLLFLSRKDVTELVLELGEASWFRLPSCLFSCQKLIRLELFGWELNPPSSFKGFKFLKHLKFQQVLIRPDALQNLISNCTLLETLDLSYYDNLQLTIRAPNLKNLTLEGDIKDISLEHTPKLLSITVSMYMTDDISQHFSQSQSCNFDKFLGCVPSLQKLTGRSYFTEYMSIGNNTFGKTEIKYQKLKVLELSQVSFDDVKGIQVILRLISNSPNLQQLQIAGSSMGTEVTDLDFWEKECPIDCRFERLKVVKMMDMCGVPHEVRFIGFLLQNSPVLESMSVTPSLYMTNERLSFLIEITRFPRASPQAQMVFVQD